MAHVEQLPRARRICRKHPVHGDSRICSGGVAQCRHLSRALWQRERARTAGENATPGKTGERSEACDCKPSFEKGSGVVEAGHGEKSCREESGCRRRFHYPEEARARLRWRRRKSSRPFKATAPISSPSPSFAK